jgi:hypothetical protein
MALQKNITCCSLIYLISQRLLFEFLPNFLFSCCGKREGKQGCSEKWACCRLSIDDKSGGCTQRYAGHLNKNSGIFSRARFEKVAGEFQKRCMEEIKYHF